MTTIACNRKMMVADMQSDDAGTKCPAHKIFRVKGAIIGIAGEYGQGLLFRDWYKDRRKKKPELTEDFSALVLTRQGIEKWENTLVSQPIDLPFYAIGTGGHLALAAMECGRDPKQAVKIACKYDTHSGLPLESEEL